MFLSLLLSSVGRYAMVAAVAFGGGFYLAWDIKSTQEQAALAKAVERVVDTTKKQDAVTEHSVSEGETHQAEIRYVTKEVIKNVPVYINRKADSGCSVPVGAVRLLSSAASGVPPVPNASGQSNDAPAGIELSSVVGAAVEDIGTCRGSRQALIDLQNWIKEQRNVGN